MVVTEFPRKVRSLLHPYFYKWIPGVFGKSSQELCKKTLEKFVFRVCLVSGKSFLSCVKFDGKY